MVKLSKGSPNLVYQVAMDRLQYQIGQIRSIDTKLSITFGFASTALAAFAGFGAFGEPNLTSAATVALGAAVVAYFALTYLFIRAYMIGDWQFGPRLDELREYGAEYEATVMERWVAEVSIRSYETNKRQLARKVRDANFTLWLLGVQVILLVLALFFSLIA